MIVGIYAEGRADLAVITNILKGALDIDKSDLRYELPEFHLDQTDLHTMPAEQHSSWTVVKKVCQERILIDEFFANPIIQESFIVIQIDTAERHLADYSVTEPVKNKEINALEYCGGLRNNLIGKINEWLENAYQENIAYAIAIEEIDAWVLTIYDNSKKDTSAYPDPKAKLQAALNKQLSDKDKKTILKADAFNKYGILSSPFRKKKALDNFKRLNYSFALFCDSLENFNNEIG